MNDSSQRYGEAALLAISKPHLIPDPKTKHFVAVRRPNDHGDLKTSLAVVVKVSLRGNLLADFGDGLGDLFHVL